MRQSDNSEAGVILRPMREADVTFLTSLWVASWRETLPEVDFAGRADWLAGFLREPGRATYLAEGADGPVGFATWEADYLHQLVVAPAAKGRAVAARLLDRAKAAAGASLTLDVNQCNARAVRFYKREGFAIEAAGTSAASGLATWRMLWRP